MKKLSLLVFTLPLFADDAVVYEYPDGLTVEPVEEGRVRMVAETVRAEALGGLTMRVRAKFYLKNLSGEALVLSVGFPFRPFWGDEPSEAYIAKPEKALKSLKENLNIVSRVNGREVPVRMRLSRDSSRVWAVWRVRWGPGETKVLETEYTTRWSTWQEVSGVFGYWLEYITETGAGWAGNIGEALVEFELPEGLPRPGVRWEEAVIWRWADGGRLSPDSSRILWEFKNWEPKENLRFEALGVSHKMAWFMQALVESLWNRPLPRTEAEVWRIVRTQNLPPPLVVQALINLAYAKEGHEFSDPFWRSLFESIGHEPKGKVAYSQLSEENRRAVDAALRVKSELLKVYAKNSRSPYYAELYVLPYLIAEDVPQLHPERAWRETLVRVIKSVLNGKGPPEGYEGVWWAESEEYLKYHRKRLEYILDACSGS